MLHIQYSSSLGVPSFAYKTDSLLRNPNVQQQDHLQEHPSVVV